MFYESKFIYCPMEVLWFHLSHVFSSQCAILFFISLLNNFKMQFQVPVSIRVSYHDVQMFMRILNKSKQQISSAIEGHQIQKQALDHDMEESVNGEFLLSYYCNKTLSQNTKKILSNYSNFDRILKNDFNLIKRCGCNLGSGTMVSHHLKSYPHLHLRSRNADAYLEPRGTSTIEGFL